MLSSSSTSLNDGLDNQEHVTSVLPPVREKSSKSSAPSASSSSSTSSLPPKKPQHYTPEMLAELLLENNQRQSTYNIIICCIVLFCAEASRGLFIPSLWSCVQHIGMDHSFLSWCIPIFSIGRMFGSYCAGSASDKWNDDGIPTIACLIASIVGGMVYVSADMNQSWMLLLLAEFTMGLGGGTLAVLRAHVSKITTDKLRMSHTTYISTAQFVGLGLMPLAALGINYYFVGPEHHEELAAARANQQEYLLASTASGLAAAAYESWSDTREHSSDPYHRHNSHRRSFHAGLENDNPHGYHTTTIHAAKQPASSHTMPMNHGNRHLLSTLETHATSTTISSAALLVGPATIHPETASEFIHTAAGGSLAPSSVAPSFIQRFINHRTAPAHLLIILNILCLFLYFMYFNSKHESFEYVEKKKAEAAKKKLSQQITAGKASGQFDVDNEAGGESGAFAKGEPTNTNQPTNKKVKELIFDISKLDSLSFATPVAVPDDSESNQPSSSSASTTTASPHVSIVQVSDTTVITLQPFKDESTSSSARSSSNADVTTATRKMSNPIDEDDSNDLEMSRHGRTPSRATKPDLASTITSFLSGIGGVAHAALQLVHSSPTPDSKGSINSATSKSSSSSSSSSSTATAAATSSQSQRIASYESGRAQVDLDDEGVYWAGIHLTPERMILWGSCLFVYLNYTIRGVLATVETVGTPTLAKFRGIPPGPLEVEASATFFGILGLLGCIVFFFQWYFQDYIDEPTSLIAGFVVTVTGSTAILLFQNSESGFIFGCVCIWSFGLPAVQNSVLAALSRILGTRPQGTWMGWIQTFGSLGRVTFPLITKIFSVSFAFFLSSLGCGIAIIALIIYMKLVKMTM